MEVEETPSTAAGCCIRQRAWGRARSRRSRSRRELARGIARLFQREYENYPTDHVITKTTCLRDPEGQEIELYAESPDDGAMGIVEGLPFARRVDGQPSDGRDPLDLDALFRELAPGDAPDARGLRYFSVVLPDTAELERAAARVRDADVPTELGKSGVFLRDPSRNGMLLRTPAP